MDQTKPTPSYAQTSIVVLLAALALCTPFQSQANGSARSSSELDRHLLNAATHFGVNFWLLKAIAMTESSLNPKATNRNSNGSLDMCFMQINSSHFTSARMGPLLRSKGYTTENIYAPSNCAMVGTFILRQNIDRYGYNWTAVGAYNAGCGGKDNTPSCIAKRSKYAHLVWGSYLKLVRQEEQRRPKEIATWPNIRSAG